MPDNKEVLNSQKVVAKEETKAKPITKNIEIIKNDPRSIDIKDQLNELIFRSNAQDLLRGFIFSEILSMPKGMRKGR